MVKEMIGKLKRVHFKRINLMLCESHVNLKNKKVNRKLKQYTINTCYTDQERKREDVNKYYCK